MGMCGDAKPVTNKQNANNGNGSPGKEQNVGNNNGIKETNGVSTNVSKTVSPKNGQVPKGRSFDDLPL